MFVPIDLLTPILDDMLTRGRSAQPPRPWLGIYAATKDDHIVVGGLVQGGPADSAGVRLGDVVQAVNDEPVADLAGLLRNVWRVGAAGAEIPLRIARTDEILEMKIRSGDCGDFL